MTTRRLTSCSLALLAAAAEARIAPLAQPPVLDGKLSPGDWDRAVSFGPLGGPFNRAVSARRAVAWDKDRGTRTVPLRGYGARLLVLV